MERTALILAGGFSSRFGQDKGLLEFNKKPLIKHVIDTVEPIVDEIIIVINNYERKELYKKALGSETEFAIDREKAKGPLVGALTGFEAAKGTYSLLLPSDTPFVSKKVLELLFDLCRDKSAVIPRWPNQQIEPLHAVYNTKLAIDAAKKALAENRLDLRAMIKNLQRVTYLSTLVIQKMDPDMNTFFNINTSLDFKKATDLLKLRQKKNN